VRFLTYADADTAQIEINASGTAISPPLTFTQGRQFLTLVLDNPGQTGMGIKSLRRLVVHHLPGDQDTGILINPMVTLQKRGKTMGSYGISNAAAEFMFGAQHDSTIIVGEQSSLSVIPSVDNPEQLREVIVYRNFTKIAESDKAPFHMELRPAPGTFTLNVEFISKSGIRNSVRTQVKTTEF